MIASLPMYWRSENAHAWRQVWSDIQRTAAQHGLDLPLLTPPEDLPEPWTAHWLRGGLLLSQTCSMPLRTSLKGKVTYVGTFDFRLEGPGAQYHSVLVSRSETGPVRTLAINGYDSQSGFVCGLEALPGCGPETAHAARADHHLLTGAHRSAMLAVAEGRADAAYLDAVSFRLMQLFDPEASAVRVVGRTRPTPGLPLITARGTDPTLLRTILREVFAARPDWIGAPELGGLRGFAVLDPDAYMSLPVPRDRASDAKSGDRPA